MMPRASDLFVFHPSLRGPAFGASCEAILDLWIADPRLHGDFSNVVDFFDFAFAVSEALIRDATDKT